MCWVGLEAKKIKDDFLLTEALLLRQVFRRTILFGTVDTKPSKLYTGIPQPKYIQAGRETG